MFVFFKDSIRILLHKNPSLVLSKGRDAVIYSSLFVEIACAELNPPMLGTDIPASEPPVIITSALPSLRWVSASTIACVDDAQADTVA